MKKFKIVKTEQIITVENNSLLQVNIAYELYKIDMVGEKVEELI